MAKRKITKKDIDKVIFVYLPTNKYPRWRWITRYDEQKKRFYAKTPKIGVLVRDLYKKRPTDFNKEVILPIGTMAMI